MEHRRRYIFKPLENGQFQLAAHKRAGKSNVQYLRYAHTFVLVATKGEHRIFEEEPNIQDVRRNPIKLFGYSIGYRKGSDGKFHASVRIEQREWKIRKRYLLHGCCYFSSEEIGEKFRALPYEPYAPVRAQVLRAYREINQKRKTAGLDEIPFSYLRMSRRVVQPFQRAEDMRK